MVFSKNVTFKAGTLESYHTANSAGHGLTATALTKSMSAPPAVYQSRHGPSSVRHFSKKPVWQLSRDSTVRNDSRHESPNRQQAGIGQSKKPEWQLSRDNTVRNDNSPCSRSPAVRQPTGSRHGPSKHDNYHKWPMWNARSQQVRQSTRVDTVHPS